MDDSTLAASEYQFCCDLLNRFISIDVQTALDHLSLWIDSLEMEKELDKELLSPSTPCRCIEFCIIIKGEESTGEYATWNQIRTAFYYRWPHLNLRLPNA